MIWYLILILNQPTGVKVLVAPAGSYAVCQGLLTATKLSPKLSVNDAYCAEGFKEIIGEDNKR